MSGLNISSLSTTERTLIEPSDLTIGTFTCTEHWGMTETMICREATYADRSAKQAQRGVLVFQPGVAQYVDSAGDTKPWKPADVLFLGEKVTCSFSLANFYMNVDYEVGSDVERSSLPCALVHTFMPDPDKSELEAMFNI